MAAMTLGLESTMTTTLSSGLPIRSISPRASNRRRRSSRRTIPKSPTWETRADVANEIAVGQKIVEGKALAIEKMLPFFPVDLAIVNRHGTIKAWLEVKCRKTPRSQFKTIILQWTKLSAIEQLRRETGIPAYWAVQWTDEIGVMQFDGSVKHTKIVLKPGGVQNRGGPDDMEPLAEIPTSHFKTVWRGDVRQARV